MIDIKWIRDHPDLLDRTLQHRGEAPCSAEVLKRDNAYRAAQTALQELQEKRKKISKEIGILKQKGEEAGPLQEEIAALKEIIPLKEDEKRQTEEAFTYLLSRLPNILADDVPVGRDEQDNVECRSEGVLPNLSSPKDHVDLGGVLLNAKKATDMSGSRFTVLQGPLAQLERALAQFMLDIQTTEFGFTETSVPLLVRNHALFGTGQLPKFSEDLFQTTTDHWLIPTAEVPLTNLVSNTILEEKELPLRFTTLTPCFRSEAGAAGKDTRGIIREHQFWKVELVTISSKEQAAAEHAHILNAAETILRKLALPFRTITLCSGDTGFASRKTWDIEVWMPGQEKYREISSCSDFGDFQARRLKARYRPTGQKDTVFVHTQNGSGLAVGRALVAVMENYQQEDGSIRIPEAWVPYMKGQTIMTKDMLQGK